jgi:hypothetical protein
MRTFGIEEEFFLLNPDTGMPGVPDPVASAALMDIRAGGEFHPVRAVGLPGGDRHADLQ